MMDDKTALKTSRAGMRLIAQMMIFNMGDMNRLREYVRDNYDASALENQILEDRLGQFQDIQQRAGKLRVQQVMATGDHHVIVLMQGQRDSALYYSDIKVEEEYPHKILAYAIRPM